MVVVYVIQYESIKGNCMDWRHVWGTPQEWEPCWTDSDGNTFNDSQSAYRALSALFTRNPDFPRSEWRIIRRETTETIVRQWETAN